MTNCKRIDKAGEAEEKSSDKTAEMNTRVDAGDWVEAEKRNTVSAEVEEVAKS